MAVLKRYVINSADFNSSSLCKNILVTIQHLDFLIKLDHKLKFENPTVFFSKTKDKDPIYHLFREGKTKPLQPNLATSLSLLS